MEQYIPKSAVLAEIENLLDKGKYHEEYDYAYRDGNNGALYALKDKLNTIEQKEIDLEKELNIYLEKVKKTDEDIMFGDFAKHFFELGLKAQKRDDG